MIKFLYLTNCSKHDGMGNLSRTKTLFLNNPFKSKKKFFALTSTKDKISLPKYIERFDQNKMDIFLKIIQKIYEYNPSVIIFDVKKNYLEKFKKIIFDKRFTLISIDYLGNYNKYFAMNWIPSISYKSKKKNFFSGWNTILLNKLDNINKAKNLKKKYFLVMSGGSDTYNLGENLIQKLDSKFKFKNVEFLWLQGPFARKPNIPSNLRNKWLIKKNPKNISTIMSKTKIAISVFGISSFELFNNYIPTIVYFPKIVKYDSDFYNLKRAKVSECVREIDEIPKSSFDLFYSKKNQNLFRKNLKNKPISDGFSLFYKKINEVL